MVTNLSTILLLVITPHLVMGTAAAAGPAAETGCMEKTHSLEAANPVIILRAVTLAAAAVALERLGLTPLVAVVVGG